MPRNSQIFHNLRKLKIALDVDRDVIDGDAGAKRMLQTLGLRSWDDLAQVYRPAIQAN